MPRAATLTRAAATPRGSVYATWHDPRSGGAPESDELCPTASEGLLLFCESHEMHALVGREREGRAMGEAHAAALAEGCELYLLRVVDRHAREADEDGYAGDGLPPPFLVAELVD